MGIFLYNEDISLPPGFELLDAKNLNRDITRRARLLHERIYYLFSPDDPGYLEYLKTCREDTKQLAKALQQELDERRIALWARGTRPPASRRNDPRINLLIRPPFLQSFLPDEEKAVTRMKADDRVDSFVLHMDPQHRLQFVRSCCPQTHDSTEAERIFVRRITLSATLHLLLVNEIPALYGNWEAVSARAADAIQKPYTFEKLQALAQSWPNEPITS